MRKGTIGSYKSEDRDSEYVNEWMQTSIKI